MHNKLFNKSIDIIILHIFGLPRLREYVICDNNLNFHSKCADIFFLEYRSPGKARMTIKFF